MPTRDTLRRRCSQHAIQNSYTTPLLCAGRLHHRNFGATFAKIIINELESEIWNRSKSEIDHGEQCSDDLLIELVLPELEVIGELAQVRIILEHLQPIVVALRHSLHLLLPLRLGRRCLSGLDLFWGAKGLIQDIILESDVICSLGRR